MARILSLSAVALLLTLPVFGQGSCNLSMTMNCQNGTCTAVTTNNGGTCSGEIIYGIFADVATGQATVTNFHSTLGLAGQQCFDASTLPIGLPFGACVGTGVFPGGSSFTMTANVAAGAGAPSPLPIVGVIEVLDANSGNELGLAYATNGIAPPTCSTVASVTPLASSGVPYNVTWTIVSDPSATFTVEESTDPNFATGTITDTRSVSGFTAQFSHNVTATTKYYYRVHANNCSGSPGPLSAVVGTTVQVQQPATGRSADATAPLGSTTPVSIPVHIDAPSSAKALDVAFTATTDKPYLTVSPSSGTIPPGGTTVTVTANPTGLPPGANTGTLTVQSNGANIATKSVSVSLVTPVGPGGKTIPPSNALIIPAVAHAPGANGPFQSDVRLTNTSGGSVQYQVSFTPTRTNATTSSKTTQVTVDNGQTIALNDIVNDFFGIGASGDAAIGALEIRPLNTGSNQNFASSRTFTFNTKGTFGQFIAAIPFSQFATKASVAPIPGVPAPTGNPVLSMQQIANSAKFRTNLGLLEGSGTPASGTVRVIDDRGTLIRQVPFTLQPGEHQQTNIGADPAYSLPQFDDGRIEVVVESATGAVTAYASVLDNLTSDPLEVMPVQVSQISATRYILPGMAALAGITNFHSDVRLYNGSATQAAQVNATFYPQGNGTPKTFGPFSIEPGGVRAFDDMVKNQFNADGLGGSIVFTTAANSQLVATGRTYTIDASGGTFGQFIPGVTPSQGIGAGDRPLQILQLEESANFRSNLGLFELSGNAAHVRVTAYVPDSKVGVSTEFDLQPNEFRQLRVLSGFGLSNVYNARVSVEVTSGTGRVGAYGSAIDNASTDPTYVPAQ